MACDDLCYLDMSKTPNDPTAKEQILKAHWSVGYREYHRKDQWNRISDWITLKKGEPYYMEARHSDHSWGDHLTVSVEINQTEMVGHHHSIKERQWLSIDPQNNKDTARITVTNADNGEYILVLKNPKTLKNTNSSPIKAKATA